MNAHTKNFRKIDIMLLSTIAVVTEIISIVALKGFGVNVDGTGGVDFIISFSMMVGIITIIRWGPIGVIPYLFAGVAMMILDLPVRNNDVSLFMDASYWGNMYSHFWFYIIGRMPLLLMGYVFTFINKDRIVNNNVWLTLYIILAYIVVSIFKGTILYFLHEGINSLLTEIYVEFVKMKSLEIGIVILAMNLIKHESDLLIDIPKYFKEVAEERE